MINMESFVLVEGKVTMSFKDAPLRSKGSSNGIPCVIPGHCPASWIFSGFQFRRVAKKPTEVSWPGEFDLPATECAWDSDTLGNKA